MDRPHEVTRIEGFSDAVFAFALTLLVVSLEVPKDMEEMQRLARGFIPFALMFAMVCYVWYEHSKFFRRYGLQDAWTAFLNCVLLFVVLFYVYPLKFLTTLLLGGLFRLDRPTVRTLAEVRTLMLLYSGGVVLIFGTFVLLYLHAWSGRRRLALTREQEITLTFGLRAHVITVLLGCLSILLALARIDPFFAGIIYALMGPLHGWNGYRLGAAQRARRAGVNA